MLPIPLFALSGMVIALSSGIMAFVMFSVGRERLHFLWGVFCVSVFTWGIGCFFIATTADSGTANFWWRITHLGIALIPAIFLDFVQTFLKLKRNWVIYVFYALAISFGLLAMFSDLLITHMRLVFDSFYYDSPPGLLYPLFTTYFFGLTIYSHYILYKSYRSERVIDEVTRLERTRIAYFFLGMLISFAGGSMSFLPVYGIDVYPVTNFAVMIYPIIIGYAILRHRLFDVRVAAAQGLTFLLWIFLGIRFLLSISTQEATINGALLISVVILGVFLVRSINNEIKQREILERQEKELELANQQQESLLHFISHEIKGYLTKSEAGFAAIVEGDYGAVSEQLKAMATSALAEARKGVSTIMDILNASNLKKGTVAFKKAPFDFKTAVLEVVAQQKEAADQKHLGIQMNLDDGIYTMEGDQEKLREHVIRNLIDNAIKYTPAGSISIGLSDGDGKIRFSVKDSGIGITDEDKKRLFTEGGHGAESIKVNVHSTGYGLFIAKQIVEAHDGKIWAESDGAGKGSRFLVEFPAAQ